MDRSRRKRITDIGIRYLMNMAETKQYKKDYAAFRNAPDFAAQRKADYQMQNRQYSRAQYMGLNTGG